MSNSVPGQRKPALRSLRKESAELDVLTENMTRLRDEIVSLRQARVAFRGELARQVAALCGAFARDRAGARRAWFAAPVSKLRTSAERQRPPVPVVKATAKPEHTAKFEPVVEVEHTPPAAVQEHRQAARVPVVPKIPPQEPDSAAPLQALARLVLAPSPPSVAPVPELAGPVGTKRQQPHKPSFKGSRKH